MKTEKNYKINLLESPVGTKMYLLLVNRPGTALYVDEVEYEGYDMKIVTRDYYDEKMVTPVYWEEPQFTLKFKTKKGDVISSVFTYNEMSCGRYGYETDEHVENSTKNVKGIKLPAYGFDPYDIIDAYFTTNHDKFVDYLTNNVNEVRDFLNNADETYNKQLAKLEREFNAKKNHLDKQYKIYGKILKNYNKAVETA